MKLTLDIGDNLKEVLKNICNSTINDQLNNIQRSLEIIMGNQTEFDAKITAANEKLDSLGASVAAVGASVTSEAQEIKDFIAGLPSNVDTSALDAVVERLTVTAADAETLSASVGGIFTAPAPEPTPEPAPAPEA